MSKIKFGGYIDMKKMVEVNFIYDDGTRDSIVDKRAVLLFQSRINSNGIISGMEDFVVTDEIINKEK